MLCSSDRHSGRWHIESPVVALSIFFSLCNIDALFDPLLVLEGVRRTLFGAVPPTLAPLVMFASTALFTSNIANGLPPGEPFAEGERGDLCSLFSVSAGLQSNLCTKQRKTPDKVLLFAETVSNHQVSDGGHPNVILRRSTLSGAPCLF